MNVAISRAREQMVVLADLSKLQGKVPVGSTVGRVLADVRGHQVVRADVLLAELGALGVGWRQRDPVVAALDGASKSAIVWSSRVPDAVGERVLAALDRAVSRRVCVRLRSAPPLTLRQRTFVESLVDRGIEVRHVWPARENLVITDNEVVVLHRPPLDMNDDVRWLRADNPLLIDTLHRLLKRQNDPVGSGPDPRCPFGHPRTLELSMFGPKDHCSYCDATAQPAGGRSDDSNAKPCVSCGEPISQLTGWCGC